MSENTAAFGPFEYPDEAKSQSDHQSGSPKPVRTPVGWDFPWNRGLWYTLAAATLAYVVLHLSSYACTLVLIEATSAVIPRQTLQANVDVTVAIIDQISDIFGGGLAIGLIWSLSQYRHLAALLRARWSDLSANLGKTLLHAALGFVLALVSGWIYMKVWSPLGLHRAEGVYGSDFTGLAAFIANLTAIVLIPTIEALFCQGLIYCIFLRALSLRGTPPIFNILGAGSMSALFFVLVHWALTSYNIDFIPTFVFGLVAAEVYRRSGNLYAPLLMTIAASALVALN
jgi:hypothetical protein